MLQPCFKIKKKAPGAVILVFRDTGSVSHEILETNFTSAVNENVNCQVFYQGLLCHT